MEDFQIDKEEFEHDLAALIDKYDIGWETDTPNVVLTKYLVSCLKAVNTAIKLHEEDGLTMTTCQKIER